MAVNTISSSDSVTYLSASSSSSTSGLSVDTETFLSLLVAQLEYQDPLDPQTDTQFVTQLAQMTSLEQLQEMNATIANSSAYDMIGKYVYAEILDEDTGITNCYMGYAESVVVKNGEQYVIVDEYAIPVSEITQVLDSSVFETDAADTAEATDAANTEDTADTEDSAT